MLQPRLGESRFNTVFFRQSLQVFLGKLGEYQLQALILLLISRPVELEVLEKQEESLKVLGRETIIYGVKWMSNSVKYLLLL
jgi:hypothetical protein